MRTLDMVKINLVAGGTKKSLGAEPVETSIHHVNAHKKMHNSKAQTQHAALHKTAKEVNTSSNAQILSEGNGGDGDGDDSGTDEGDTDEGKDGAEVGSDGGLGGDADTNEYGDTGNFNDIGNNETGNDVAASDPDGSVASAVKSDLNSGDTQSAETAVSNEAQSLANQAEQGASASPDLTQGFQDLANAGIHGVMTAAGIGLAVGEFNEGNVPAGMMPGAQALDNAEKAINEATTPNARAALDDIIQSIEKTFEDGAVPQS